MLLSQTRLLQFRYTKICNSSQLKAGNPPIKVLEFDCENGVRILNEPKRLKHFFFKKVAHSTFCCLLSLQDLCTPGAWAPTCSLAPERRMMNGAPLR